MKTIFINLLILVDVVIYSNAQLIPNAGFENWTNLKPDDWETNSCPLCDPPYETYIVQQDTDACQGIYSARFIYNNYYSSWAETKITTSIHPSKLFACVKTNIQSGDSVKIDIMVFNNGINVDEGHWINRSTIPSYTNITIPISQHVVSVDSVKIKFTGGTQTNTILVADNLSFTSSNAIPDEKNNTFWTLSPNPFADYALLKFNNSGHEKFILKIYDASGQILKTIDNIYTDIVRIDKDNLTNGLYFFKLYNNTMIAATGKLLTSAR